MNPLALFRALVIYGICLPLAIYMGYLLATPQEQGTLVAVGMVLMALITPLLLRWYHPLLILSWNLGAVLFVLPGEPQLWLAMAAMGVVVALVQRALSREKRFLPAQSVVIPLVFLITVVIVTGMLTGGMGFRAAGSATYGGKRYLLLIGAVMGFFALTSRSIPPEKANRYVGLFYLSGVMAVISSTLMLVNPSMYFIFLIFPPDVTAMQEMSSQAYSMTSDTISRLGGLAFASEAVFFYLLAVFGIRRLIQNKWGFLLLLLTLVLSLFGGFRSIVVLLVVTFATVFFFEGLVRSRVLPVMLVVTILGGAILVPFAQRMPLSVQRSLSFLPLDLDFAATGDAQDSTNWRLRIWRTLLPEVPHYLLLGKGYGINADELEFIEAETRRGADTSELALLAGDYHSGPFSVIIPLGIWGMIGILWLMVASLRALYRNYRHGDSALKQINTFLLAYYLVRVVFFFFVFGSLYSDLWVFTGLIGFSISLNGGIKTPPVKTSAVVGFRKDRAAIPS